MRHDDGSSRVSFREKQDQPVLRPSVVTVFMRQPRRMRCALAHIRRTISHGRRRIPAGFYLSCSSKLPSPRSMAIRRSSGASCCWCCGGMRPDFVQRELALYADDLDACCSARTAGQSKDQIGARHQAVGRFHIKAINSRSRDRGCRLFAGLAAYHIKAKDPRAIDRDNAMRPLPRLKA